MKKSQKYFNGIHKEALKTAAKKFDVNQLAGKVTLSNLRKFDKENRAALLEKEITEKEYFNNLKIMSDADPSNLSDEQARKCVHDRRMNIRKDYDQKELPIKARTTAGEFNEITSDAVVKGLKDRLEHYGGSKVMAYFASQSLLRTKPEDIAELKKQIERLQIASALGDKDAKFMLKQIVEMVAKPPEQLKGSYNGPIDENTEEKLIAYYQSKEKFQNTSELTPELMLETYSSYRELYCTVIGSKEQFEDDMISLLKDEKVMKSPILLEMANTIESDSIVTMIIQGDEELQKENPAMAEVARIFAAGKNGVFDVNRTDRKQVIGYIPR